MKYHTKKEPSWSVRIFIGSREGYNGDVFSDLQLKDAIKRYQHDKGLEKACPVRITETAYIWDDYEESGWEIGILNYPRRSLGSEKLNSFALDLAAHLLEHFKQNRISVEFPYETVMLEVEEAEEKHK